MSYYDIIPYVYLYQRGSMLVTFLIVLGILALFGAGDVGDACAITLLLKVLPFLIFVGILASLMFRSG